MGHESWVGRVIRLSRTAHLASSAIRCACGVCGVVFCPTLLPTLFSCVFLTNNSTLELTDVKVAVPSTKDIEGFVDSERKAIRQCK